MVVDDLPDHLTEFRPEDWPEHDELSAIRAYGDAKVEWAREHGGWPRLSVLDVLIETARLRRQALGGE